jgi:hypothetical protein
MNKSLNKKAFAANRFEYIGEVMGMGTGTTQTESKTDLGLTVSYSTARGSRHDQDRKHAICPAVNRILLMQHHNYRSIPETGFYRYGVKQTLWFLWC